MDRVFLCVTGLYPAYLEVCVLCNGIGVGKIFPSDKIVNEIVSNEGGKNQKPSPGPKVKLRHWSNFLHFCFNELKNT